MGGLQWSVTAWHLLVVGFVAVALYVRTTGTEYGVSVGWPALPGVLGGAFVAGALWVGWRGPTTATAHRRRIETVVGLFVLASGSQFLASAAIFALGIRAFGASVAAIGASYLLTLAVVYGVAYGLDVRVLFSPDDRLTPDATGAPIGETPRGPGGDGERDRLGGDGERDRLGGDGE